MREQRTGRREQQTIRRRVATAAMAIGVVLFGIGVAPGVASAHHPHVSGTTQCRVALMVGDVDRTSGRRPAASTWHDHLARRLLPCRARSPTRCRSLAP